jgi:D-alanyl-D-alanine carboxypeptidase
MGSCRGVRFLVPPALAALVLAGCTAAGDRSGAPKTAVVQELRAAAQAVVDHPNGPPGVIVVVQRGSEREVVTAGVADVEDDARPGPDLHMRIASTAKAYSGGVALSLVDDGALSLDDTVGDLLPWAPAAWSRVTVGQALHHTSGLPDFTAGPRFQEYVGRHLDRPLPPRRVVEFVNDEPLEFPPGSEYRYSNTDNVVVALMAQAATGRPYERLLADEVLEPLGLEGTSLPRGVRMPRPFMHGYQREDDGTQADVSEVFAGGWAWASGGIVSTAGDQNRFIRGYVGGKLFGRDVQRAQFDWTPGGHSEPPGPGDNAAGLAVFRYRTGCGTVYGHTGNIAGYTQFIAASADGRRSAVVSINRQATPQTAPVVFRRLREVFRRAVCAAYAD